LIVNDLTPEELTRLRELIVESDRASWAWKKVRILVPAAVAVVYTLWQVWEWVRDHVKVH
jgi:hypothetical protein